MSVQAAGVNAVLEASRLWLRGQQQQLEATYELGSCDWEISQTDGLVTYRRHERVVMRATYVMLGSYCSANDTWLWAWANPTVNRAYAIAPNQTIASAQQVGVMGLAQPLVTIRHVPALWRDDASVAERRHATHTVIGQLVGLMTRMAGGVGVQYYLNPATKTIGWVALRRIYAPVESV